MEYTVQKLASLTGISTRALRYYDEIGILKPVRINSSGYRIYGQSEVDRLQQIRDSMKTYLFGSYKNFQINITKFINSFQCLRFGKVKMPFLQP